MLISCIAHLLHRGSSQNNKCAELECSPYSAVELLALLLTDPLHQADFLLATQLISDQVSIANVKLLD